MLMLYELKKIGKIFTSKFVRTGPSSHKKRIYRAAVSQSLRNTGVGDLGGCFLWGERKNPMYEKGCKLNLAR